MLALAWAVIGAVIGPICFAMLIGTLEAAFSPHHDEFYSWLIYAIPAGAIFGSITGCVLGLAAKQKFKAACFVSVISALGLGFLHIKMWSASSAAMAYAFAQVGPGLLWSAILFGLSVKYFGKSN